jgi:hypothetical protein
MCWAPHSSSWAFTTALWASSSPRCRASSLSASSSVSGPAGGTAGVCYPVRVQPLNLPLPRPRQPSLPMTRSPSRTPAAVPLINQLDGAVGSVRSAVGGTASCPVYCLNLESYSFISGNRCICDTAILDKTSKACNEAWRNLVPAVIGMVRRLRLPGCPAAWMLRLPCAAVLCCSARRPLLAAVGLHRACWGASPPCACCRRAGAHVRGRLLDDPGAGGGLQPHRLRAGPRRQDATRGWCSSAAGPAAAPPRAACLLPACLLPALHARRGSCVTC